MPIHLRATPGEYAPVCLLPGDPRRAAYLAERFLTAPRQVNHERALWGYTGLYQGRPVSIQASGMGAPSAAIVIEELVQLGVRSILRVGTCGALRPEVSLGELLVVLSAIGADGTTLGLVSGEPHTPTSDWGLVRASVQAAQRLSVAARVGSVVSTDLFYDPRPERFGVWARRGALAAEMEAAAVLTLGALRGVAAGCLLVVSDLATTAPPTRIDDEGLRAAVDRMALVALEALTSEPERARQDPPRA